eukprot:9496941-Pyramimonas_sp.AAC.1
MQAGLLLHGQVPVEESSMTFHAHRLRARRPVCSPFGPNGLGASRIAGTSIRSGTCRFRQKAHRRGAR